MANLVDATSKTEEFSILNDLLASVELVDFLRSPGPFTVLAPTNEAFSKLPDGTLDSLQHDHKTLKRVLMYHILSGDVRSDDLAQIDEAPTEEGSIVAVSHSNKHVKINDANVLQTDLLTDNGVIHTIDQVLIPGVLEDNL